MKTTCPNCGNAVPDNSAFCSRCGSRTVQSQVYGGNKLNTTNKTIKIALISIAVIAIVSVFIYFLKGIVKPPEDDIAKTPFEKYIEAKVKAEIEGKDYQTASTAFNNVLKDIETEASIINSNGAKQLTDNEVSNCKKKAFFAYMPIFDSYQQSYFIRSSWSDGELQELKSKAKYLKKMNLAEGQAEKALSDVISNVDDYYDAWKVVKSARSCTSVDQVNRIKSNAESYKRAPLTNNASLSVGLNSAYSEAKNSLANNIKAYCRSVAKDYKNYGSYDRFVDDVDSALKRIGEYENTFEGVTFSDALDLLIQAELNAKEYYDIDY